MMDAWPFHALERRAYGAIVADPPWYFRTRTTVVSDRDPQQHYPVMGVQDIAALPVRDLAAPDAHLFLWANGATCRWRALPRQGRTSRRAR